MEEAAQLPEDVVAELIERIVVSHHGGMNAGIDAAWKAETRQRVAEIVNDQVKGIPWEESLGRVSRQLRA